MSFSFGADAPPPPRPVPVSPAIPTNMVDKMPPDEMALAMLEPYIGPKSSWGPAFNGAWECATRASSVARSTGNIEGAISTFVSCAKEKDAKSKQIPLMIAGAAIGGLALGAVAMHLAMKRKP